MTPATQDEAIELLEILFNGFPNSAQGTSAEPRLKAYLAGLKDVSAWALSGVIGDICAGATDLDPRFCPTPAQVARLCRLREAVKQGELERARQPPLAPDVPVSENERQRRVEKARRASAEIGMAVEHMRITR